MNSQIPVTLLTGFLGSGKTTLVNHLLTGQAGRRIAVVVNEFGELGVDAALIADRSDDVLELTNGCVCCASRGDLATGVARLLEGGRDLDHILVESSGLADPGPVIESLVGPPLADRLAFTGTVTCVDAANFDVNLGRAEAAYNQLTHADLLIINKTDLVREQAVTRIGEGLSVINATADQLTTVRCALPAEMVLEPRATGHRHRTAQHGEPHRFSSVTVATSAGLEPARLRRWLCGLPDNVVRAKGLVRLAGQDSARVVQYVSGSVAIEEPPRAQRTTLAHDAPGPGGADRSTLVLIGTDLDPVRLQREFAECAR